MTRKTKIAIPTYYWGEGGQYGPFDVQQDGEWARWPDFGQVLRYFRKKAGVTIQEFCILYGSEVNGDGCAVSERWILKMELNNKVPVDVNKRKTLARLFEIPPMLFGLAILEDFVLKPQSQAIKATGQTKLVKVAVDTTRYQNNGFTIWQLHATSNAQGSLTQLYTNIQELESLEQQTKGELCLHIQELLFSDQILATHVVRDQRQFSRAYYHSNEAVRVAKNMKDNDLIATALFTRARTRMEWGMFGTIQRGIFQVQQDKIEASIHDLQEALDLFPGRDNKESMHPQLFGPLMMEMKRAQAILAVDKGERIPAALLLTLDDIADTVGKHYIDDPYTRVLVKGSQGVWHAASYLNVRATIFTIANYSGQALKELRAVEQLREQTYRRDETRRFTWEDIQKANAYIELEEYAEATRHAKQALLACQDINSATNTAIITDIYGRLLTSRHKKSSDVQELGDILRESPVTFIEPEE